MSRFALTNILIITLGCFVFLAACAPSGIYHTVKPGQTLYRIARTYKVEEGRLARINRIKDPTQLKADQKLFIPGATHLRTVPSTSVSNLKSTPSVKPKIQARKKAKKTTRIGVNTSNKATVAKKSTKNSTKPSKGIFAWPAKGKILNNFGKQSQKVYKGIEIDLAKGSSVKAAASGKVIYSGNAISGYGNLVILEHSNGYFSIYGYNQKNVVKLDDHVGQGEKIALSGLPPNGQSARLHFEIRKGKSAVNPILYLP